ncbi:MAG: SLBB domain-containing protein [Ignavibacteriaceae bacterium]|jgi:protein involved in polysaccharide export with SLBB domain|nr:SLBB domain-containing protein [bacterium BMS3Abin03]
MKIQFAILTAIFYLLLSLSAFAQQLNPGDGVRISFLDINDNISGDYYVEPDGVISLPFVGVISTNHRDFQDVKKQIVFRYDSLYKSPKLTVHALFRINILGEVRNPGYYYVTEIEKFTGILALAGGTTADADLESIYIIRDNKEIEIDVEAITQEGGSASDLGLQSGDQIYVPRTWWADARGYTVIISAAALVVTVLALVLRK